MDTMDREINEWQFDSDAKPWTPEPQMNENVIDQGGDGKKSQGIMSPADQTEQTDQPEHAQCHGEDQEHFG